MRVMSEASAPHSLLMPHTLFVMRGACTRTEESMDDEIEISRMSVHHQIAMNRDITHLCASSEI